jgi:hypothetical protein
MKPGQVVLSKTVFSKICQNLGTKEKSEGPLNSDKIKIAIISSKIAHTILKNTFKNSFKKDNNKMVTPCKMMKERTQVS